MGVVLAPRCIRRHRRTPRLLDTWAETAPSSDVEGLRVLVYDRLGFRGDVDDYHQPANSYLDEVLRRRQGMPITLAVVLLALGRRIGVELVPIGAPGHFLVKEPVSGSCSIPSIALPTCSPAHLPPAWQRSARTST